MKIKNVLVPADFSPPSRLAVNYGVSLARQFRAKLTLMHVVESPPALGYPFGSENPKVEAAHREQAMRMLSALLAPEDQDDLDLQPRPVTQRVEADVIAGSMFQQAVEEGMVLVEGLPVHPGHEVSRQQSSLRRRASG